MFSEKPKIRNKRHTGEGRYPGISDLHKKNWTPAPVPDSDPGFAGVTTSSSSSIQERRLRKLLSLQVNVL